MAEIEWTTLRVDTEATVRTAMRVIDRGAQGIALVCAADGTLVGTISDGDVRRGLLAAGNMDDLALSIANTRPWAAGPQASRRELLAAMKRRRIAVLPIVNEAGQVLGVETLSGLIERPRIDNVVFIMAGGFGTRLRPLTADCPKPMLTVGGKPMLEHLVERFVDLGFHHIIISTHYLPDKIRSHFGTGAKFGASISYVHEEFPLGTAGALGLLPEEALALPLLMINGDVLTNVDFVDLLRHHDERGNCATMCVREYEYQVPFGVVEGCDELVTAMVEKPTYRYAVNAGIYVLDPQLVRSVPLHTRIDMPALLGKAMAAGDPVGTYGAVDFWLDIGRLDDYERAQVEIGLLEAG